MSLLDRAKAHPVQVRTEIDPEQIEVALAWIRDEITISQAGHVLSAAKEPGSQTYVTLAIALRAAYRKGQLVFPEPSS
jgi:hypothetical protein